MEDPVCTHPTVIVDYLHPHSTLRSVPVTSLQESDPARTRPSMTLEKPRCADCGDGLLPFDLMLRTRRGGDLFDERFVWSQP